MIIRYLDPQRTLQGSDSIHTGTGYTALTFKGRLVLNKDVEQRHVLHRLKKKNPRRSLKKTTDMYQYAITKQKAL